MGRASDRAARRCGRGVIPFASRLLAAAIAGASAHAGAAEPVAAAAVARAAAATVVVEVTLNRQSKGQYFAALVDGKFLLRAQDLKAIGLQPAAGRALQAAGVDYVGLTSLAGVQVAFDEARMALDLTVDARLLPSTTVEMWPTRADNVVYPDNASAFLNYQVGYAGGSGGIPDGMIAATQFGGRIGDLLLLSESTCAWYSRDQRCARLATSLVHDRRETMVRTIVGDFSVAPGSLGTTINMGGLSYSKVYDIDPYFIRYPQQNLTGQLSTPSEVDVYIDGQRVRTLRLPPGEYDLRNVTQSTGYRSVDLVIRDSFGREQRVSSSYYSNERSLKAGLHEYSYNVGALRENFPFRSNDYGPVAFAGFHRYGVSDALTVGVRAEGKSGLVSGGPTAAILLGPAGLLSLAASFSDNDGRTGVAALANYSYQGRYVNAGLLARKDSRDYATLLDFGRGRRNYEAAGSIGYTSPTAGSISIGGYVYKAFEGDDRSAATLSYGRTLFAGRASVFLTVANEWSPHRQTSAFAGFTYNFDADYALTGYYQRLRGSTSETLQFQKSQPVGEGLGYAIGVSRNDTPEDSTTQFTPSFQYNGRWATLRGYAQQGDGPGSPRSYALSAAGGVAWTGGMLAAGRPVTDSFGVIKVDELEGVRVLVNNEEIGRTGKDGRLFVPSLASFIDNQISIDVRTVPLDFTFPESVRIVSPAYRAGAKVDFHATRLQAYAGTLKIRQDGVVRAAEFFDVTLDIDGMPFAFVTGRGGEYYIEALKEGRYRARAASNGTRCAFELDVRPAKGVLTDLGETVCE